MNSDYVRFGTAPIHIHMVSGGKNFDGNANSEITNYCQM